jgi:hypothetical protein
LPLLYNPWRYCPLWHIKQELLFLCPCTSDGRYGWHCWVPSVHVVSCNSCYYGCMQLRCK